MGKLSKEIKSFKSVPKGNKPYISFVLESLSLEDARDLVEAIYDHSVRVPSILAVMKERGFNNLSATMIMKLRHKTSVAPNPKYFR